jgi:hypothetical protein
MARDFAAAVADLLRQLAGLVDGMDDRELTDLLESRSRLVIDQATAPAGPAPARKPTPPAGKPKAPGRRRQAPTTVSPADAAAVRERLATMTTKEEARPYVDGLGPINYLKALADAFDVPYLAKERRDDLIDKIINRSVGIRLLNAAMDGTSSRLAE